MPSLETLAVLLGALAGSAAVGEQVRSFFRLRASEHQDPAENTLDHRVADAKDALERAASAVGELQADIERRHAIVDELASRQALLELTREQVEAVAQTLQGDLGEDTKRFFWRGVVVNLLFFLAGIGASVATTLLID
ncbi:hypothetical protein OJ998_04910 [Solirubrobacter taibaiensis]|nr:hypothetical protein [Solirubrobacter taibaiensis]